LEVSLNNKTSPKVSISSIVQRANDLVFVCRNDRVELENAGLCWESVERIAILLQECSVADAEWKLRKEKLVRATADHKKFIRECRSIRSHLAANIRTAVSISGSKVKLPGLYKNWKQSDLVQDLNDLAFICNKNRTLFEKTSFDFDLATLAACRVRELSNSIANLVVDRELIVINQLSHRNLTYNELYTKIKDICVLGRKAFSENSNRKRNYYAIR
jgi:hypothetical protein